MAKNQELFFTKTGKVKQLSTPVSALNTLVYTDYVDLNADGIRLMKARVVSYDAVQPIDIEYISLSVFDGTNYYEISRINQAELAIGTFDFFEGDTFPLDKNSNKYLNLDYATGKIVVGVKSSSINNNHTATVATYHEEFS